MFLVRAKTSNLYRGKVASQRLVQRAVRPKVQTKAQTKAHVMLRSRRVGSKNLLFHLGLL